MIPIHNKSVAGKEKGKRKTGNPGLKKLNDER